MLIAYLDGDDAHHARAESLLAREIEDDFAANSLTPITPHMKGRTMFTTTNAFSGFAVDDINAAKKFYGDTLQVPLSEEHGMLKLHLTGRDTLIYPKEHHHPADYTILNFPVDDIDQAVTELTSAGISLEHFDGVDEHGVFRLGGPLIAWFKDPAGNILSVIQEG